MRGTRWVPPAPGNRPTFTSGRPSRVFGIVGGDAVVAGQRQLKTAAERETIDGGDPRLA